MRATASGCGDDVCAECDEELLLGIGAGDCIMCRCTTACLCVAMATVSKECIRISFSRAIPSCTCARYTSNTTVQLWCGYPLVPSRARCIVLASYAQNWRCVCLYLRAAMS